MATAALITGASAGLGLEYAKLFAADKHDLVLVARRKDRLDALGAELTQAHGVQVHVIAADLMDHTAPEKIIEQVKALGVEIEFLVNNAGFGTSGAFAQNDPARELGMVEVNVTALVALTRAFLPAMIARKSGRVLNIGSTAGFQAGPFMSVYYATKAFVNSFSEGLWYELKGTGVSVTASCPGATATEFSTVAGTDKSRLFALGAMTSAEVALQGYRAMQAGRPLAVHGLKNILGVWSVRFAPRGLLRRIAARLNESPKPPQLGG